MCYNAIVMQFKGEEKETKFMLMLHCELDQ